MRNILNVDIRPNMAVITHNSLPVVTTELLAQVYGTDVDNIKKNFGRNANRFSEGVHYFKLESDVLRQFKHKVTESHLVKVAVNARHLMLWTERGAARHAKMLETDQAWQVFEKLEDCYFSQQQSPKKTELLIPSTSLAEGHYEPKIKRYTCQDGRDAIARLRNIVLQSLTGDMRDIALNECKEAEVSLITGWTDMDESIMRITTAVGMLSRWRDKH